MNKLTYSLLTTAILENGVLGADIPLESQWNSSDAIFKTFIKNHHYPESISDISWKFIAFAYQTPEIKVILDAITNPEAKKACLDVIAHAQTPESKEIIVAAKNLSLLPVNEDTSGDIRKKVNFLINKNIDAMTIFSAVLNQSLEKITDYKELGTRLEDAATSSDDVRSFLKDYIFKEATFDLSKALDFLDVCRDSDITFLTKLESEIGSKPSVQERVTLVKKYITFPQENLRNVVKFAADKLILQSQDDLIDAQETLIKIGARTQDLDWFYTYVSSFSNGLSVIDQVHFMNMLYSIPQAPADKLSHKSLSEMEVFEFQRILDVITAPRFTESATVLDRVTAIDEMWKSYNIGVKSNLFDGLMPEEYSYALAWMPGNEALLANFVNSGIGSLGWSKKLENLTLFGTLQDKKYFDGLGASDQKLAFDWYKTSTQRAEFESVIALGLFDGLSKWDDKLEAFAHWSATDSATRINIMLSGTPLVQRMSFSNYVNITDASKRSFLLENLSIDVKDALAFYMFDGAAFDAIPQGYFTGLSTFADKYTVFMNYQELKDTASFADLMRNMTGQDARLAMEWAAQDGKEALRQGVVDAGVAALTSWNDKKSVLEAKIKAQMDAIFLEFKTADNEAYFQDPSKGIDRIQAYQSLKITAAMPWTDQQALIDAYLEVPLNDRTKVVELGVLEYNATQKEDFSTLNARNILGNDWATVNAQILKYSSIKEQDREKVLELGLDGYDDKNSAAFSILNAHHAIGNDWADANARIASYQGIDASIKIKVLELGFDGYIGLTPAQKGVLHLIPLAGSWDNVITLANTLLNTPTADQPKVTSLGLEIYSHFSQGQKDAFSDLRARKAFDALYNWDKIIPILDQYIQVPKDIKTQNAALTYGLKDYLELSSERKKAFQVFANNDQVNFAKLFANYELLKIELDKKGLLAGMSPEVTGEIVADLLSRSPTINADKIKLLNMSVHQNALIADLADDFDAKSRIDTIRKLLSNKLTSTLASIKLDLSAYDQTEIEAFFVDENMIKTYDLMMNSNHDFFNLASLEDIKTSVANYAALQSYPYLEKALDVFTGKNARDMLDWLTSNQAQFSVFASNSIPGQPSLFTGIASLDDRTSMLDIFYRAYNNKDLNALLGTDLLRSYGVTAKELLEFYDANSKMFHALNVKDLFKTLNKKDLINALGTASVNASDILMINLQSNAGAAYIDSATDVKSMVSVIQKMIGSNLHSDPSQIAAELKLDVSISPQVINYFDDASHLYAYTIMKNGTHEFFVDADWDAVKEAIRNYIFLIDNRKNDLILGTAIDKAARNILKNYKAVPLDDSKAMFDLGLDGTSLTSYLADSNNGIFETVHGLHLLEGLSSWADISKVLSDYEKVGDIAIHLNTSASKRRADLANAAIIGSEITNLLLSISHMNSQKEGLLADYASTPNSDIITVMQETNLLEKLKSWSEMKSVIENYVGLSFSNKAQFFDLMQTSQDSRNALTWLLILGNPAKAESASLPSSGKYSWNNIKDLIEKGYMSGGGSNAFENQIASKLISSEQETARTWYTSDASHPDLVNEALRDRVLVGLNTWADILDTLSNYQNAGMVAYDLVTGATPAQARIALVGYKTLLAWGNRDTFLRALPSPTDKRAGLIWATDTDNQDAVDAYLSDPTLDWNDILISIAKDSEVSILKAIDDARKQAEKSALDAADDKNSADISASSAEKSALNASKDAKTINDLVIPAQADSKAVKDLVAPAQADAKDTHTALLAAQKDASDINTAKTTAFPYLSFLTALTGDVDGKTAEQWYKASAVNAQLFASAYTQGLLEGLIAWPEISFVLENFKAAIESSDLGILFEGLSLASDKRAALVWYKTNGSQMHTLAQNGLFANISGSAQYRDLSDGVTLSQVLEILSLIDTSVAQTGTQRANAINALWAAHLALKTETTEIGIASDLKSLENYKLAKDAGLFVLPEAKAEMIKAYAWYIAGNHKDLFEEVKPFLTSKIWANSQKVIENYFAVPSYDRVKLLGFGSDAAQKQALLQGYLDSNEKHLFAKTTLTGVQNWSQIEADLKVVDVPDVFEESLVNLVQDKKSDAISWYNDSTNGASNRLLFANSMNILQGLSSWDDILAVMQNYSDAGDMARVLISSLTPQNARKALDDLKNFKALTWGNKDAFLATFSTPEDIRSALIWGAQGINQTYYDHALNIGILTGKTTFLQITEALNGDVAAMNSGVYDDLSDGDKALAYAWYQITGNPSKLSKAKALLDSNVNTWSAKFAVIENFDVAQNDAAELFKFASTNAEKRAILASYANDANHVYFSKAVPLLEAGNTWSDIAPVLALLAQKSAQEFFGGLSAGQADALSWYKTPGNPVLFSKIQGVGVLGGLSVWNDIKSVIDNYALVDAADISSLLSIGEDAFAKRDLITGYLTGHDGFKAAFDAGILKGLVTWSTISPVLAAYTGALADSVLESLLRIEGRIALMNYSGLADQTLFKAANNAGLFGGVNSWEDANSLLTSYKTASSDGVLATLMTVGIDVPTKRTLLSYYATLAPLDKPIFKSADASGLFSGLISLEKVNDTFENYKTITSVVADALLTGATPAEKRLALKQYISAGSHAPILMALVDTPSKQRTLLQEYIKDVNFEAVATIGLFENIAGYQDIKRIIQNYVIARENHLFETLPLPADKKSAYGWYQSPGNSRIFELAHENNLFEAADSTWSILDSVLSNFSLVILEGNLEIVMKDLSSAYDKKQALVWYTDNSSAKGKILNILEENDLLENVLGGFAQYQTLVNKLTVDKANLPTIAKFVDASFAQNGDERADTINALWGDYNAITTKSILTGATSASVVKIIENYKSAGSNAELLISIEGITALDGYAKHAFKSSFKAAYDDGLFDGLNSWSAVSSILENYGKIDQGTRDILLSDLTGAPAKQSALSSYLALSAQDQANVMVLGGIDGAKVRGLMALNMVYFNAAYSAGLLNGKTALEAQTVLAAYETAAKAGLFEHVSSNADMSSIYTWNLNPGAPALYKTVKDQGLLDGLDSWTAIEPVLAGYANINPADLSDLFKNLDTAQKRLAISWYASNGALFHACSSNGIFKNIAPNSSSYQELVDAINGVDVDKIKSYVDTSIPESVSARASKINELWTNYIAIPVAMVEKLADAGAFKNYMTITSAVADTFMGTDSSANKIALENYILAGSDADALIALGTDAAKKQALLSGFAGDINKAYFKKLKNDAALSGKVLWGEISIVLASYANSKIEEKISSLTSGHTAVIDWLKNAQNKLVFTNAHAHGIIEGMTSGNDMILILNAYAKASQDGVLSLFMGLSNDVTVQRTAIDTYANLPANMQPAFIKANKLGLFAGLTPLASINTLFAKYEPAYAQGLSDVIISTDVVNYYDGLSAVDKTTFKAIFQAKLFDDITLLADITEIFNSYKTADNFVGRLMSLNPSRAFMNDFAKDAKKDIFGMVYGSDLITDLTSWSDISGVLAKYDGSLSSLFSKGTTPAKKRALLDWGKDNKARWNAVLADTTNHGNVFFTGMSELADIDNATTWWSSHKTEFKTVYANDPALIASLSWDQKKEVIQNYITAGADVAGIKALSSNLLAMLDEYTKDAHKGYFADSVTRGILDDLSDLSAWDEVSSILSDYDTAQSVLDDILGESTGEQARNALHNYAVLSSYANLENMLSLVTTASDKQSALVFLKNPLNQDLANTFLALTPPPSFDSWKTVYSLLQAIKGKVNPASTLDLFLSIDAKGLFSDTQSGPLSLNQKLDLIGQTKDQSITPAQINAIAGNADALAEHTSFDERVAYLPSLITGEILTVLTGFMTQDMDPVAIATLLMKSGLSPAQILAADEFMKNSEFDTHKTAAERAHYIEYIAKFTANFEAKGLFGDISSGVMTIAQKQTLIHAFILRDPKSILNIPVDNISDLDMDGLIKYINYALALDMKQSLYKAYNTSGMLDVTAKSDLIKALMLSSITVENLYKISSLKLESDATKADLANDTGTADRISAITALLNLSIAVSSKADVLRETGFADDGYFNDASDATKDDSAKVAAYDSLKSSGVFQGVDLTASKTVIDNFNALSTWGNSLNLLRGLSGGDVALALAYAQTATADFDSAYYATLLNGLTSWTQKEAVIADYAALTVNKANLLSFGKTPEEKRTILQSYKNSIVPNKETVFDTVFPYLSNLSDWSEIERVMGQYNMLVSDASQGILSGVTGASARKVLQQYSDIKATGADVPLSIISGASAIEARTALDNYTTLNNWTTVGATNKKLISYGGTPAEKRAALTWGMTSGNKAKFEAIIADSHAVLTGAANWSARVAIIENFAVANTDGVIANILDSTSGSAAATVLNNYAHMKTDGQTAILGTTTGNDARTILANYETNRSWANLGAYLSKIASADKAAALAALNGTLQGEFDAIIADSTNHGNTLFDHTPSLADINSAMTWWKTPGNPAKFKTTYDLNILGGLTTWAGVVQVINDVNTAGANATTIASGANASDIRQGLSDYVLVLKLEGSVTLAASGIIANLASQADRSRTSFTHSYTSATQQRALDVISALRSLTSLTSLSLDFEGAALGAAGAAALGDAIVALPVATLTLNLKSTGLSADNITALNAKFAAKSPAFTALTVTYN